MEKPEDILLVWEAELYEPKHKSIDWFWVLGFVGVLGAGLSLYFGSLIFALVIAVSCITLGLYANDHMEPEVFTLTKKGLYINDEFTSYKDIASYWVFEGDVSHRNRLLLTLKRNFFVHTSLPTGDISLEDIRLIMRKYVLEKQQSPSLSDEVMDMLRF